MAALVAVLVASPWYFEAPWWQSDEDPFAGLSEASDAGECVEVCWRVNGRTVACSPMERIDNGLKHCEEHMDEDRKLLMTQMFEAALDGLTQVAQERITNLQNDIMVIVQSKPQSLLSQRDRAILGQKEARINEIEYLLHKFREKIEQVPQEAKPPTGE